MAKTNEQLTVISNYLQQKVDRIGQIMPSNASISAEKLVRVVLLAINDNPALLSCTPESVYAAVLEGARLGLEIGGALPQSYLVPYGRKAVFQVSYRGLIALVLRSKSATQVNVEFVHEGDKFYREGGMEGKWLHQISNDADRESRPVTHVYSEFKLQDGSIQRHTMTATEINEHAEKFSKSLVDDVENRSPWRLHWKAMAAKTVIRQPILRGLIPIDLPSDAKKHVLWDENPAASLHDFGKTFGMPKQIECTAGGEILSDELTDEEKAAILAAEREAG